MTLLPQAAIGGNDLCGDIRFRHLTTKAHQLGSRPYGELLAKLARLHPAIESDLMTLLEQYSALDGAFLKTAGLDRWQRFLVPLPSNIRAGAARKNDIVRAALGDAGARQP